MTWRDRVITIEATIIVLLATACFVIWRYYYNPQMVYEWRGKTTETIYVNGLDCEYCQKSPIWIDGKQIDDFYRVRAGDACKSASRDLSVRLGGNYHGITPLLIGAAEFDPETKKVVPGYGAELLYSYTWGPAGISTGAGVVKFSNKYNILTLFGGTFRIQDK